MKRRFLHDPEPDPPMSKPVKSSKPQSDSASAIDAMNDWPSSWAGVPEDETIGKALVAEMRPFVEHLERSFSARTVRGHLNCLWVIGGEIIRRLDDEPRLRKLTGRKLLLEAIEAGEAPLASGVTEAEQKVIDATARRLLRFMTTHGTK